VFLVEWVLSFCHSGKHRLTGTDHPSNITRTPSLKSEFAVPRNFSLHFYIGVESDAAGGCTFEAHVQGGIQFHVQIGQTNFFTGRISGP
jgi:hypothetical protein